MKKLMTTFVFAFLLVSMLSFVTAAEVDPEAIDLEDMAGITPGNVFYGFDKLMDSAGVMFTFDKAKKAAKALGVAEERMAEVEYLAENGHFEKAKKARAGYAKYLGISQEEVEKLYDEKNAEASEESLRKITKIEGDMQRHGLTIEAIEERMEQRENAEITPEQKTEMEARMSQYKMDIDTALDKIEQEREKARIKHKVLANLSDDEMEGLLSMIEEKEGFKGQGWKPERPEGNSDALLSRTASSDMLKERLETENLTEEERVRIEEMISFLESEPTNSTEERLARFNEHRAEMMEKYEDGEFNDSEIIAELESLKGEDGRYSLEKIEEFKNSMNTRTIPTR